MVAPANNSLGPRYVITLIGESISTLTRERISKALLAQKIDLGPWQKLGENPVQSFEASFLDSQALDLAAPKLHLRLLRQKLLLALADTEVDLALQIDSPSRRTRKLFVFDMDSTLIQNEVVDELAREKNVYAEVSQITERAMKGELDFDAALRLRCKKLAGLTLGAMENVQRRLVISPGARELITGLKNLGCRTAVVSGGFTFFADQLKTDLGLDFAFANQLEMVDQKLTGRIIPPILNAQGKANALSQLAHEAALDLTEVVAIGDGANDLPMIERAGLGIAYHAKALVREKADFSFSQKSMVALFYLLGLKDSEF